MHQLAAAAAQAAAAQQQCAAAFTVLIVQFMPLIMLSGEVAMQGSLMRTQRSRGVNEIATASSIVTKGLAQEPSLPRR